MVLAACLGSVFFSLLFEPVIIWVTITNSIGIRRLLELLLHNGLYASREDEGSVRESIPHIGLISEASLKLFLDMVPSSPADIVTTHIHMVLWWRKLYAIPLGLCT